MRIFGVILAGGAEGFPPGEVVETFADLKAEGNVVAVETIEIAHEGLTIANA